MVGYAGTGKSTMLGVARAAWEASGYRVRGAALSGIAAEGLEGGAGIESRTLASLEHGWARGRDLLTRQDVLVVDEAGMVGSRQLERVLSAVREAGAKVVLVGDPEQLQAIEAGAAFRAVTERVGAVEITAVHRQREVWQQDATRELATGQTAAALARDEAAGMVREHGRLEEALAGVVAGWDAARQQSPEASQIMLAHRRVDVQALNEQARALRREAGELGADQVLPTAGGDRVFAEGDRIYFLKNERSLGVKNGTLGTVERIAGGGAGASLVVRLETARRWPRRHRPGGVVRAEGLRRDQPRLCGDGAQVAGGDGGPGACAGDEGNGPAHGLCRAVAAPGGSVAALEPRRHGQPGGVGRAARAGAAEGHQPGLRRCRRGAVAVLCRAARAGAGERDHPARAPGATAPAPRRSKFAGLRSVGAGGVAALCYRAGAGAAAENSPG